MVKINYKKALILFAAVGFIVVIFIVINSFINDEQKKPAPYITSTSIENDANEVASSSDLEVVFEENISETEKNKIKVVSKPDARFSKSWINNTLVLKPVNGFQNNTRYKISVYYDNKLVKELTFNTSVYSKEELELHGREQAENDYLFSESVLELYEQLPFLDKLPIKTGEYRAVYDFERESIRIRLLISNNSSEVEKEDAKQSALKSIAEKDLNLEEIPHYFLYLD